VTAPWYDGPLTAFDTESTGIDVTTDRIVSAYVGRNGGDQPPTHRSWLINPGVPIPAGATAIHGITDEQVQRDGTSPARAISSMYMRLILSMASGVPVVGYNLPFDLTLLWHELKRYAESDAYAVEWYIEQPADFLMPALVIDAMVLDKHVDPYRKGSRKLVDTARHYGVQLDDADAHGAKADALAACAVARAIGRMFPEIGNMTAQQLHDAQVGWADEQRTSLEKYLRRTKGPAFQIERGWPVYAVDTVGTHHAQ
jgi:DNA polymerase-3 subunit epsilon